jgi:hypothetical protein
MILSVRDRASLIDVLNENQRMQQWWIFQEIYIFTIVASVGFHLIHGLFNELKCTVKKWEVIQGNFRPEIFIAAKRGLLSVNDVKYGYRAKL